MAAQHEHFAATVVVMPYYPTAKGVENAREMVRRANANLKCAEERLKNAQAYLALKEKMLVTGQQAKVFRLEERPFEMAKMLLDGCTAREVGKAFGVHPTTVSILVKGAVQQKVNPRKIGGVALPPLRRCAALLLDRSAA